MFQEEHPESSAPETDLSSTPSFRHFFYCLSCDMAKRESHDQCAFPSALMTVTKIRHYGGEPTHPPLGEVPKAALLLPGAKGLRALGQ